MVRWKSKGCPRCGGATFIEKDGDGWFEQCLMCSNRTELKKTADSVEFATKKGPVDEQAQILPYIITL